jgi:EH_Signature domain
MNNELRFREFTFLPLKLRQQKEFVKKKYNDLEEQDLERGVKKRLPHLLEQIRKIPLHEKHKLIDFADKLMVKDVRLIAYAYPYEQENNETLEKIVFILSRRTDNFIGRLMWNQFQVIPHDTYLQVLIRSILIKNRQFLNLEVVAEKEFASFLRVQTILSGMVTELIYSVRTIEETLVLWKVRKDSTLYWMLIQEALYLGISQDKFIQKEKPGGIIQYLSKIPHQKMLSTMMRYIDSFEHDSFENMIINHLIHRIGEPNNKNNSDWNKFSASQKEKIHRWLMYKQLKKFFSEDNKHQRFDYWKKYIRLMKDIDLKQEPPIAIMDFDSFIAVEFGRTGNAAYFYEPSGFYKHMNYSRVRGRLTEGLYKDQNASYFIKRLLHTSDNRWHSKFDEYMNQFLKKNFHYDHKQWR